MQESEDKFRGGEGNNPHSPIRFPSRLAIEKNAEQKYK